MHHRLGHSALAPEATREAVRVAQQSAATRRCRRAWADYGPAWPTVLRAFFRGGLYLFTRRQLASRPSYLLGWDFEISITCSANCVYVFLQ